jgi:HPt (histidine-containing phosphotransfer) domain-containing protein
VNQYFAAGMNAFISKPFHEDELLLKMDSVMGNTPTFVNNKPNTENNVKEEAPPNLPDKVTDMQFLKQLTNGNEEKMKKYINMFLDNAPKLLDNIDKALAIKDYPTIKIAAHSLKPQLSYMGVKEEVSKIFMIEQSAGEAAHFGTLPILIRNLNLLCNKAFIELKNN